MEKIIVSVLFMTIMPLIGIPGPHEPWGMYSSQTEPLQLSNLAPTAIFLILFLIIAMLIVGASYAIGYNSGYKDSSHNKQLKQEVTKTP